MEFMMEFIFPKNTNLFLEQGKKGENNDISILIWKNDICKFYRNLFLNNFINYKRYYVYMISLQPILVFLLVTRFLFIIFTIIATINLHKIN